MNLLRLHALRQASTDPAGQAHGHRIRIFCPAPELTRRKKALDRERRGRANLAQSLTAAERLVTEARGMRQRTSPNKAIRSRSSSQIPTKGWTRKSMRGEEGCRRAGTPGTSPA